LIGNEWRSAAKRYCLTNPATEEPLAEVAEAGEEEIDAAVQAALDHFVALENQGDLAGVEKHQVVHGWTPFVGSS